MKKSTIPMSTLSIAKKVRSSQIRFDLEVQRREVWTLKQKQKLIDSFLFEFPVPHLYFIMQGDIYYALDGQQRCRAIEEFLSGTYPLLPETKMFVDDDGTEYEIAGKKFDELPDCIRTTLNAVSITGYKIESATQEEIAEMFVRLNGGTPMKKIELTRVLAGPVVMRFINDLSQHEFFTKKTAISDKAKVHFTDHDMIFQAIALSGNKDIGFSGNEIEKFAIELQDELSDSFKADIWATTDYLNSVFNEPEKYLKKGNLPVVFNTAQKAMKDGIPADDMKRFYDGFFVGMDPESDYMNTLTKDSAKKIQVSRRMEIIGEAYNRSCKIPQEI